MQDRFKFRTWNLDMNFFTYWGWLKGGEYKNVCSCREISKDELLEKYTQQCTGLRDKNGKLIYEGDILELYVSTKKAYRYQVKYEIGSFMLVSPYEEIFNFRNRWNDNVYPLSQLYFEYENEDGYIWHCEVIGNIYENRELLEDK